jgi:hypothetical protein
MKADERVPKKKKEKKRPFNNLILNKLGKG